MKRRTYLLAFSLHELLIVLSILGITMSIAIPAFSSLQQKSQQLALRDSINASLHQARLQAILNRTTVEMCGTFDGDTCHDSWTNGWRWYAQSSPEQPLQIIQTSGSEPIYWSGAGFDKRIRFFPNGTTSNNGRFFQCREQQPSWQLVINRQGRVRLSTAAENTGEEYRCALTQK